MMKEERKGRRRGGEVRGQEGGDIRGTPDKSH